MAEDGLGSGMESLLLEVGKVAIGLLGGFAGGWWIGRREELKAARDRRRADLGVAIDDTEEFLVSRLDLLTKAPTAESMADAASVRYGRKDERLIGSAALYEAWLS